ncbi:MAG: DUF4440 domain-containing protein [Cyclobacteriaceae bacterium]|nr:DUF4440 domain-containing protein [Cyclobacteriaceae bacterium]
MNYVRHIVLLLLVAGTVRAQTDTDMIKRVIEQETTAYLNADYKTWADAWVHEPYVYWSYTGNTGTRLVEGWEAMKKAFERYFKSAHPAAGEVVNRWEEIRIYENGAYVRFTQHITEGRDQSETVQIRTLEKQGLTWRIVCMQAIDKALPVKK